MVQSNDIVYDKGSTIDAFYRELAGPGIDDSEQRHERQNRSVPVGQSFSACKEI